MSTTMNSNGNYTAELPVGMYRIAVLDSQLIRIHNRNGSKAAEVYTPTEATIVVFGPLKINQVHSAGGDRGEGLDHRSGG